MITSLPLYKYCNLNPQSILQNCSCLYILGNGNFLVYIPWNPNVSNGNIENYWKYNQYLPVSNDDKNLIFVPFTDSFGTEDSVD